MSASRAAIFVWGVIAVGCGGGSDPEAIPADTGRTGADDGTDSTLDTADSAEPIDSNTPIDSTPADSRPIDSGNADSAIDGTADTAAALDAPADVADTSVVTDTGAGVDACAPAADPCGAAGKVCGTASDGCGGTVTCTGCSGTCSGDYCVLTKTSAVCSTTGWCFRHPAPQPHTLNDIYAVTPIDVYAVGVNGTIIHFDGTKWSGVTGLGTGLPLRGVWASGSTDVWAVGGDSFGGPAVFRGSDAAGFAAVTLPVGTTSGSFTGVWGTSSSSVGMMLDELSTYTVTAHRWNGTALVREYPGYTTTYTPTNGYFETSATERWFTTDSALYGPPSSGTGFGLADYAGYNSVWGTGTDLFAAGPTGRIKRRLGTSWVAMTTPSTTVNYLDIAGSTSSNVYAVGVNGTAGVVHQWDGTSWTNATPPSPTPTLRGVVAASGLDVVAVGDAGAIRRRLLGTWTDQSTNLFATAITASSVYGADNVWFASKNNATTPTLGLLHWNGKAWDATLNASVIGVWASGPASALYSTEGTAAGVYSVSVGGAPVLERSGVINAIWGSSTADVWAVGQGLTAHRVGGSWSTVPNPLAGTTAKLLALWGTSASDVWAGGDQGYLLHWNGTAWTLVTSGTTQAILSIAGTSSSDVWAVTSTNVLHWNGTAWSIFDTISSGTFSAIAAGTGEVWMASSSGLRRLSGTAFVAAPANVGVVLRTIHVDAAGKRLWAAGNSGVAVQKDL